MGTFDSMAMAAAKASFSLPKFGAAPKADKALKTSRKAVTPAKKAVGGSSTVGGARGFNITVPRKFFSSSQDGSLEIPIELGFTKANELFVGRAAMLGFGASIFGEALTGKGPLAQFDVETGINLVDTEGFVLALIAFNIFAALAPAKGKFVPAGSPEGTLANLFPSGKIGWTKENEIFVGRMAQLGFAASLIGEVITGKGALAQFDFETGLPLSDTEPLLLFFIALVFLGALNDGTGKFITDEDLD